MRYGWDFFLILSNSVLAGFTIHKILFEHTTGKIQNIITNPTDYFMAMEDKINC